LYGEYISHCLNTRFLKYSEKQYIELIKRQ